MEGNMTELYVFCFIVFVLVVVLCAIDYTRVNREYRREMEKIEGKQ